MLRAQTDLELAAVYAIYRGLACSNSASLHHSKPNAFTQKGPTYLLVVTQPCLLEVTYQCCYSKPFKHFCCRISLCQ